MLMLLLLLFTESEIERLVFELGETPILVLRGWEVSTSFLERWRPLCMCLSQYFFWGTGSLLHLHFFPSVLLHLPGSGPESIIILLSEDKGLDLKTRGRKFSSFIKYIKECFWCCNFAYRKDNLIARKGVFFKMHNFKRWTTNLKVKPRSYQTSI
jgi:hypothetical protein